MVHEVKNALQIVRLSRLQLLLITHLYRVQICTGSGSLDGEFLCPRDILRPNEISINDIPTSVMNLRDLLRLRGRFVNGRHIWIEAGVRRDIFTHLLFLLQRLAYMVRITLYIGADHAAASPVMYYVMGGREHHRDKDAARLFPRPPLIEKCGSGTLVTS